MVKKKELSKDEKLKIQVWTVAGVITAEVAACLGHGELTIRRLRAELKELLAGCRHHLPISGYPRTTIHAEDERLKQYVEKFPSKMPKN
jgi:hypothetical protein